MGKVKVMQVAGGGYGAAYLRPVIDELPSDSYEYVGIVDPMIDRSMIYDQILESKIPLFNSIEDFYKENTADLVVIAAPISFHAYYTIYALEHGSNVLCEKPISATLQDAIAMKEAQERTGKFVMIGFQWSYARAMLAAKQDFLDGLFGKPVQFKMHVLWKRAWKYYARNNWAGKLKDARGNWVLDSVAHNATAHYLNNEFFMQGNTISNSSMPVKIEAELYRANDIDNFDTCAIRTINENGCETLYYTTHAIDSMAPPTFSYKYEKATLVCNCGGAKEPNVIYAIFNDGTVKVYGKPDFNPVDKLHDAIDVINGEREITCDLDSAMPHLRTINFLADFVPIHNFPEENIVRDAEQELTYVPKLQDVLVDCFDKGVLPSEIGVSWAIKPEKLDMSDYKEFLARQYK